MDNGEMFGGGATTAYSMEEVPEDVKAALEQTRAAMVAWLDTGSIAPNDVMSNIINMTSRMMARLVFEKAVESADEQFDEPAAIMAVMMGSAYGMGGTTAVFIPPDMAREAAIDMCKLYMHVVKAESAMHHARSDKTKLN